MGFLGGQPARARRLAAPGFGAAAVALVVGGTLIASALAGRATPRHHGAKHTVRAVRGSATGPALFHGLGSWTDIYEHQTFAHPARAVRHMAEEGVRTLYIETTNYKRDVSMKWPGKQAMFITAAHREGMKIVAWYLPGFRNIRRDFRRVMAAVDFRTSAGQGFDGFALDIESPAVRRARVRTTRLNTLSDRIRAAVGPTYPLGAIIPTPLGMKQNPTYWPGFPYRHLTADYQAILPMTYFTWRVSGWQGAHDYTAACIRIIRRETGDPTVPIHVIGGISDGSTVPEARGFVRAVRQKRVVGASYYAFHGTTDRLWKALQPIRTLPDR